MLQHDAQNSKKYLIKNGFRSSKSVFRIPWNKLSCEGRKKVIKSLFPKDKFTASGWEHIVAYTGTHGETLWRICTWFTGSGTHVKTLIQKNRLDPQKLAVGSKVQIPSTLLQPCFSEASIYPVVVDDLTFRKDKTGEFAEYVLLEGQTIYSLVLRYTPRVSAEEVLAASNLILKRSDLKDFHSIPARSVLKIPSDIISPQFLSPDDPRRIQFDATDRESSHFKPTQKSKSLDGITVVLDSGHGGVDPGSLGKGGVKEDEYAYDVMCRVKNILEKDTKARVFTTIEDEETGFIPRNTRVLGSGKNRERILTNPMYMIEDAAIALNLRWILANHLYSKSNTNGSRDEKIVFTSFHADCLHASAQGMMVYIPGADYYSGNIKKTDKVYLRRKESGSGGNSVSNDRRSRLKAEGFSVAFAKQIKEQCARNQIRMHSNQPIRKFVIRNHRSWVPGILRYTKIPTRILIELANLQNPDDVNRMKDWEYREALASTYVDALRAHFEE